MAKMLSVRAAVYAKNRRQAYLLLIFGVVFLFASWLLHPDPYKYPLGVFLLGLGILVAALTSPIRLMIAGLLITALGSAVFLTFAHLIPGNQVLPAFILAIGIALLFIAFTARQGYIRAGAVSPGILVVVVGLIEFLVSANLTPTYFIPFMLSLWLPGIGLLIIGILYLLTSGRA